MKAIREMYGVKYFKYSERDYQFVNIVESLFGVSDLSRIHEINPHSEATSLFTNENDDQTFFHNKFYKKLNDGWPDLELAYRQFIKNFVANILDVNEIIFQSKPTFRVQLPNNIAVGGNAGDKDDQYGWHRDSDPEYNHPLNEKNFIVPLTNSADSASVFIETHPYTEIFKPAIMNVGEVFNFNGGQCKHGNKPNSTGLSRVSFDFRVVLPDDYDESYSKSSKISTKKFTIGGYYDKL